MSIFNTTENSIMALLFNATAWADVAENDSSSPHTQIAAALHTGDPGEAGTLSTSEATYGSYARVNTNRNSGGFTVTNNSVSPAASIDFAAASSGSETISYFSFGKTGGGAAAGYFSGAVSPTVAVSTPIQPKLGTSTACTLD